MSDSSIPEPYDPRTSPEQLDRHDVDSSSALDIINEPIPHFDHQALVVAPFEEEAAKEVEFQQRLTEMLIEALIKAHAWASRRTYEDDINAMKFEERINNLMQKEREQGMYPNDMIQLPPPSALATFAEHIKDSLSNFVLSIKAAVEALAGFSA